MMTPRDRVLATINFKVPDKIVTEFGSTNCTSIAKKTYCGLKSLLGYNLPDKLMMEDFQISLVDDAVLENLETETRGVPAHPEHFKKRIIDDTSYYNHFGIKFKMPENGLYFGMVSNPLADMELAQIKEFQWPDPYVQKTVSGCRERAQKLQQENKYAIIGDIVDSGIFEPSHYLRGFENFLVDLITNIEVAEYILEKMLEFQCARQKLYLDEVGEFLDIIFVGDDLATTQSTLISPEIYRSIIKPIQKRYFNFIKRKTNAKLMYHSCGCITPFIEDLIEIGVDILNPIQVNANSIDTKILKTLYGDRLCFCGAIDTNRIMPNGTIEDIKSEVQRRIDDLGPEGYILTAVHNIQADVPAENVLEMYRAAKVYNF